MAQEEKKMNTDMLLGEIKARLDSLSRQLSVLEDHVGKGIDKLELRVTELEKDQNRLKGIIAAAMFVSGFIIPVLTRKLGF
jgi:hypothetical protein